MTKTPKLYASAGGTAWSGISYFPNDNLALAIVKAWTDPTYEAQLLTFGREIPVDWAVLTPDGLSRGINNNTKGALAQVDVYLDTAIVLTPDQYSDYMKAFTPDTAPTKFVFVLPDPPGRAPSLATAQVTMAVHPCGI